MNALSRHDRITALVDDAGRLCDADPALALLHRAHGGEPGGPLAILPLAALAAECRMLGLPLARSVRVGRHGGGATQLWVEARPWTVAGRAGVMFVVDDWRDDDGDPAVACLALPVAAEAEPAGALALLDPAGAMLAAGGGHAGLVQLLVSVAGQPFSVWIAGWRDARGASPAMPEALDGTVLSHDAVPGLWQSRLGPAAAGLEGRTNLLLGLSPGPASSPSASSPLASSPWSPSPASGRTEADAAQEGEAAMRAARDLAPALRQPISRIVANAETIAARIAGPLRADYVGYARHIAEAARHLIGLIDDLADLEVIEADGFVCAREPVDLADAARRAAGLLAVRARERQLRIDLPDEDERLPVTGEFRRVLQVLLNLIGNALAYSPPGSAVWVRLDEAGGRGLVTVADQGAGMSEAEQARLFRKFERLGRSGDGGSGLGLYISRRLARAMGGDLTVESAPGQGARFTLALPLDQGPARAAAAD